MRPMVVTCRKSDIRRIKISCRCGTVSIAEVPQQVARALNLHPCPGCGAGFAISQNQEGKWLVDRCTETIEDAILTPVQEQKRDSYIGLRIRIVKVAGKDIGHGYTGADPHPEHIGKCGTIVGEENAGGGYTTPRIKLDDGTMLMGTECWWEPIKM